MFKAASQANPVEIFPGVVRRTLSTSDRAMLTEVTITRSSRADAHHHPNDEMCYVTSGRIRAEIGGDSRELGPGDSYSVPAGETHAVQALDDSVCVVVFSPVREEYLD